MSAYIDIPLTTGRWLTLQRLSVFSRLDFSHHIKRAYELLGQDNNQDIREFYVRNSEFRHHCDTALSLHHVPPDQISDDQFITLLFSSPKFPFGILNQFNFDITEATQNAKAPARETKGSLLGKLFKATGDVQVALKLAQDIPVDVLEGLFEEMEPQDQKSKRKAKNVLQRFTGANRDPD